MCPNLLVSTLNYCHTMAPGEHVEPWSTKIKPQHTPKQTFSCSLKRTPLVFTWWASVAAMTSTGMMPDRSTGSRGSSSRQATNVLANSGSTWKADLNSSSVVWGILLEKQNAEDSVHPIQRNYCVKSQSYSYFQHLYLHCENKDPTSPEPHIKKRND